MRSGAIAYRPAKGQQGEAFQASLCARCRADTGESVGCMLLIRGLMLKGVQLFPAEWVLADGEPSCTAFSPIGARYRNAPPVPATEQQPAQMQLAL